MSDSRKAVLQKKMQTIGQKLPDGFQRSEFLLEHGFVDKIVERKNLRKVLATIIRSCCYES